MFKNRELDSKGVEVVFWCFREKGELEEERGL